MTFEELKQLELQKLYIRNLYSKDEKKKFKDLESEVLFEKLALKEMNVDKKVSEKYLATLLTFDEVMEDYIRFNSNASIINIGNGLDTRKYRIKKANTTWYYVGNSELNTFYSQYRDEKYIDKDPFDYSWFEEIKTSSPTRLIVLEDFIMYQEKEKVVELIDNICKYFKNVTIMVETVTKPNDNQTLAMNIKDFTAINKDLDFVKQRRTFRGMEKLYWYNLFLEFKSFSYSKVLLLHKN